MNSFKIGNTEFGIGEVSYSLEDNVINLEICADELLFEALTKDEGSK